MYSSKAPLVVRALEYTAMKSLDAEIPKVTGFPIGYSVPLDWKIFRRDRDPVTETEMPEILGNLC